MGSAPSGPAPAYTVELLRPSQDRSSFACGVTELDSYFHHRAGQDLRRKVATPFVMLDGTGAIVGYYTLSAYAVRVEHLPSQITRHFPKYPLLPATLLGRLAVSQAHQGQRLGQLLLMDALRRCLKNTTEIASIGIVVDALNDAAREFYLHHEFTPLPDHPKKLFIPMKMVEVLFSGR